MALSWEMSCDECDDDTIIIRFDKKGKLFTHSWYQCTHCGTTDWHQKSSNKFTIFTRNGGE